MKILFIFGTRPEAIKMAPVLAEAGMRGLDPVICATAQHREMLDQALELFELSPDFDLDAMRPDQTLSGLTAHLVGELDRVVSSVSPEWVLVQGDTTSAMAGALVSFYHQVKVGHIEAGLRTYDNRRPFPEELNRRAIDLIADACFAPTEWTAQNLINEGMSPERIFITGNTVVDALIDVANRPFDWESSELGALDRTRRIALVTAHRRESFGEAFRALCLAIRDLALSFPDVQFVYPVHLNPNVQKTVRKFLGNISNVLLLPPVRYPSFVQLMKHACLILTDSGGVQEEGPTFGAPVLVMRETTERPEGVEAGVARLVGTDRTRIVREATGILQSHNGSDHQVARENPYGDGKAAGRILDALLNLSVAKIKKTGFPAPVAP